MADVSEALHKLILGRDFCDIPTAWAIQHEFPDLAHHSRCSSRESMLCDCNAVPAKWHDLRAALARLEGR